MNNFNLQRFKNGDAVAKAHFKSYLAIAICFIVFSILLFIQHTFTLNEIKNIRIVFLLRQLVFFFIGLVKVISIYISSHLSIKEIFIIFLSLVALAAFALLAVFKPNVLSSDAYIFITNNLHYYLVILGELACILIFKLIKIKHNSNIS